MILSLMVPTAAIYWLCKWLNPVVPVAALLEGYAAGAQAGVVLSGGNVDFAVLPGLLAGRRG